MNSLNEFTKIIHNKWGGTKLHKRNIFDLDIGVIPSPVSDQWIRFLKTQNEITKNITGESDLKYKQRL